MDLKQILSISGYGGLFKMVKQARNAVIVESLETKQRMPVYASSKISSLEDIAIYTYDKEIALAEVFRNIFNKENGGEAISHKSTPQELLAYFEKVLPNFERERVYIADIKRVVKWYNELLKHGMLDFPETVNTEEGGEEANVNENEEVNEKNDEDSQKEPINE